MGSMLQGSGGQTQTSNQTFNQHTDYTPQYDQYVNNLLQMGQTLGAQPYTPYTGQVFAPFTPDQTSSFGGIEGATTGYQPYLNSAGTALGGAGAYNPVTASQPFMGAAAGTPTGYSASNPYFSMAGASTWPQAASSFMNPYITNALAAGNKLASENFTQNVLPGLNSQFVASGGGLGSHNNAYDNSMNWALTNFNNSLNTSNLNALSSEYNNAANQFFTGQNNLTNLGTATGNMANNTATTQANLGATAGNLANGAFGNALNLGNAYTGLAGANTSNALQTNEALNTVGNQQQQQAQNPLTFNYQQFEQGINWPYQMAQFENGLQSGLQIPTNTSGQSYGTTTTQQTGSPSPLGAILGGLSTIGSLAIPGAGGISALGNMFSGFGNLFTGGGGMTPAAGGMSYGYPRKRGGFIRRARGGPAFGPIVEPRGVFHDRINSRDGFAAGGYAPSVRAQAQNVEADIAGARKKAGAMRQAQRGLAQPGRVPTPAFKRGGALRYANGGIAPSDMTGVLRRMAPDAQVDYGTVYPLVNMGGASVLRDSPMMQQRIQSSIDSNGMMTPGGMTTQLLDHMGALGRARMAMRMEAPPQQAQRRGGAIRPYAEGGRFTPTPAERRADMLAAADRNARRAAIYQNEAARDPVGYWKDFARQVPLGLSDAVTGTVDSLAGLAGAEPDTTGFARRAFRAAYGPNLAPITGGGDAGYALGNLLPYMSPAADAAVVKPGALRTLGRGLNGALQMMNIGDAVANMPTYRRGGVFRTRAA